MDHFPTLNLTASGYDPDNALICAMASAAAYDDTSPRGLSTYRDPEVIVHKETDTHAVVMDTGNAALVAVRGTKSFRNLLEDMDLVKKSIYGGEGQFLRVHSGFWRGMEGIYEDVKKAVKDTKRKLLFIAGHSYGGAVGTDLACFTGEKIPGVTIHSIYTYGSPRTGNSRYAAAYNRSLQRRTIRITRRADAIPWMPGWLDDYRHVGNQVHFDHRGRHENFPLVAELVTNGREILRELRRGQDALLDDHHVDKYVEDVSHFGGKAEP
jgi:pimeloyl-ACP methyl ester carboxylesterase